MKHLASQYLDDVPQVDVAIVLPHPGDAEMLCGGTIAKLCRAGKTVAILDLTAGEAGTLGRLDVKLDEAAAAGQVLGVAWRACVRLPDARVEDTMMSRMTVTGEMKRLRAKTVVAMHWDHPHPDSRPGGWLVENACFQAGLSRLDDYLDAHRAERIVFVGATEKPSFVVDIGDFLAAKMAAIECYSTLVADTGEVLKRIEAEARHFGAMIGVKYGEGFTQRKPLRADLL